MSMLTAQVERLRETAELVDFELPEAAAMLREAADTIERLRQTAQDALAERTCEIRVFDNMAETDGMGDVWLECSACHWQMDYSETPRMPLNYCPNCGRKVVDE